MQQKYNIVFTKACGKLYFLKLEAFNFRYNISFIDPPLGRFGRILPDVIVSLWVMFRCHIDENVTYTKTRLFGHSDVLC